MKHLLLILTFCCFGIASQAQSYTIEWGELQQKQGGLVKLMPFHGKDFYSLIWKGGGIFGGYAIARYDDLKFTAAERISMTANNSMANYEGTTVFNDHVIVFLSDKKDGKNFFFMQEYGYDLQPRGEVVELANYELEKGRSKGWFEVVQSKNKEFIAIVWQIPGRKDQNDFYGYKVYNTALDVISEGSYTMPFDSRLSEISTHIVTNTGDYFLTVKEFQRDSDKVFLRNYLQYKAMHIYHVNDEVLDDYTIPLTGKRVENISLDSDDNEVFTITGVYGENYVEGVKGIFYLKLNYKSKTIISEGFKEFDNEFITAEWTDKEKKRAEKREDKGKGAPSLYDYMIREVEVLPDGSFIGTLEQYYVVVRTSTDSRGVSTTSYTYYYNDIIAFKVNSEGTFDWMERFKKMQVSTNDGGPYSSYARFVDKGKMYFIFNDNIDNYREDGTFTNDRLFSTRLTKRKNTVALIELDMTSGVSTRKTYFDREEIGAIAMPKQFTMDYMNNEMLIYTIHRNKEKYGMIKFNPQD